MAILTDPPEWRVPGPKPPRNIIEEQGWEVASHPPAPWFNWFFHRVFESLLELESATLARVVNEAGVPSIMAGPESERPAASQETAGRIYIATDTKRMFRDRGNGWDLLNTPEAIGAETPAGAQAKADAAQAAAQAYADAAVAAHAERTDNPHQVTAAQLGLGDVLTNLAQILSSRILDHNLDVANPPNGRYVRWENGLQVCWRAISIPEFTGPNSYLATNVAFPAAFVSAPIVIASLINDSYHDDVTPPQTHNITGTTFSVGGHLFTVGLLRQYTIHVFAIGAWK